LQGVSPQPGAQAAGLRMESGQMVAGVIPGQGEQTVTHPRMPLGESSSPGRSQVPGASGEAPLTKAHGHCGPGMPQDGTGPWRQRDWQIK
jgi:hypothetical protein